MANNSDEGIVKILIEMGLKAEAAQQAVAEINKIGEAAKQSNSYVPEAWASWQKYKGILNETGESALSTREKIHLLHAGLHGVGAAIPGIGMMAHLLFNPLTAGFAVGTIAIEGYFKHLEKVQEAFKNIILKSQQANNVMKEIIASGGTMNEKFIEFSKTMADLNIHVHGVVTEIADLQAESQQLTEQMKAAADAQKTADADNNKILVDRIELLRQIGIITNAHATELKTQVELQAKLKALEDERTIKATQMKALQIEQRELIEKGRSLPSQAKAEKAVQDAQSQANIDKSLIEKGPEEIKALKDAIDSAVYEEKHTLDGQRIWELGNFVQEQNQKKANLEQQIQDAKDREDQDQKQLAAAKDIFEATKQIPDKLKEINFKLDGLYKDMDQTNKNIVEQKKSLTNQFFTEQTAKRFGEGQTPQTIIQGAANAMQQLQQLQAQGVSIPNVLAHGTTQQKQYVQGLEDQLNAFYELEEALGNNGQAVLSNLDLMVKNQGALTQQNYGLYQLILGANQQIISLNSKISQGGFKNVP